MTDRPAIRCHDGEVSPVFKYSDAAWQPFDDGLVRCSYCGSVDPLHLVKLFEDGVQLSVEMADQKYGFPHKIYVGGLPCPKAGEPHVTSSVAGGDITAETPGASFHPTCGHADCTEHGFWEVKKHEPRRATVSQAKFYLWHLEDLSAEDLERFSRFLEHHLRRAVWRDADGMLIGPVDKKGQTK